jgi:hypothetical protein
MKLYWVCLPPSPLARCQTRSWPGCLDRGVWDRRQALVRHIVDDVENAKAATKGYASGAGRLSHVPFCEAAAASPLHLAVSGRRRSDDPATGLAATGG